MPLTDFQAALAKLLSCNRSEDSHLAGGAALHFEPHSTRYSNDLDYFHDSPQRVATAFEEDQKLLLKNDYSVSAEMQLPGYIRAQVAKEKQSTKVEWAHDSAWRFMPAVAREESGYQLHPVDLAVNKVLTLAGRDEPRDFLDVLYIHRNILPLGAVCWAAAGKDPGFTPLGLLELLRRRGKYQPEDFSRLRTTEEIDLVAFKKEWQNMLGEAESFIRQSPPGEVGCLYYSPNQETFGVPSRDQTNETKQDYIPHYGRPGGVLPRVMNTEIAP